MTEPTIVRVEIPNPFFEGRNQVYVIPEADPVTLIDTGVATEYAFDRFVERLEPVGVKLDEIGRVILTHKHIDHIGNAWRIQRATGAEILIHESEAFAIGEVDPDGQRYFDLVKSRLSDWQVPEDIMKMDESKRPSWEIESATPTELVDGQMIDLGRGQNLEVIHTPGHTYGSICLKLGRSLISGDHVLPDISPNVGGGDMRHRGLLSLFMQSLKRISDLSDEIDVTYPGHGAPFETLAERCHELRDHHQERLGNIFEILEREGQQPVYQTATHLWGELKDFHVVLGCAEAQSHLDYLVDEGKVLYEAGEYRAA